MQSSPVTAAPPIIDREQLRQATLDNPELEREVLGMFVAQSSRIVVALAGNGADAGALAHTLTGSARAIGAKAVAEAAQAVETAIRQNGDRGAVLAKLDHAVGEAHAAIDQILRAG